MAERLDIILFGATGFTGKYCIQAIHRLTKCDGRELRWGIAGRSEPKLREVLDEYQNKIGSNVDIPIIIADINDEKSLRKMTASAKIIINCCGPYRLYGEPVVKACIETGTHQVDVTGETQYMETIQLKYHKAAEEKGVYIVSSCGVDSIPADLGVIFLQNKFKGTLNEIEGYLQTEEKEPIIPGSYFNYGTWESVIHSMAHAHELSDLRKKLYTKRPEKLVPELKPRSAVHRSNLINAWGVPFFGSDRSVILRTQQYLYEKEKARPVQVQLYQGIKSLFNIMNMAFCGSLFMLLVKYDYGRKLLLQYPELFSAGIFSHESPNKEKLEKIKYILTLHGKGWDEKLPNVEQGYKTSPSKNIIGQISCTNPAYGMTCTIVSLAAIVVLTETDKLPGRGGVYPPGAAFRKTTLLDQLHRNGLTFEIKSKL